ncbi:hypothetical protein RhiirA5_503230 [Rhizophagus irregularis]|uniref:HCP-like protein n=2 Tax=Rhizophagus irregularis TaxID=588596 RepID=A0A2N0RKS6_9GLOM|nr:hypothetical protein RhiirA5_503230 [Rhizophagus irregularis]PKC63907.1 hypothetical protein RhiirA1_537444 [Rhizophagus irregularis]CAB5128508.1 unnamed protein product [Rhizophagus irregularis]CAB5354931.1 unnamed protein product [Rhizophagus irregularis]
MSTELQNDETSGSDTVSASISNPRTHSIRTESLFTESRASSILSQLSEIEQDDTFKPNEEQRKRVKNFLGYYECLIDNSKLSNLSIPTISISTARIDLHKVINRKTDLKEGKHWVSTKIKESPCIKNTSLFVITGKGKKVIKDSKGNLLGLTKKKSNYEEWTGTKFNEFPRWMQYVVHLLDGIPVKGLGNYEVFIKKAINTNEISEDTLEMLKSEAEKEDDTNHKLALAGIYMKGNERNNGNYYETNKCYIEAKDLCLKAAKLGSIEAKLCLGYIYSVGFTKNKKSKLESDYQPNKAKKLFKKVARNKNDNRIARIAMRNIATLFHCEEIKPKFLEKVKNIGFGTKKPLYLQKAEKWYRKSLGLEDSQSAYQLGLLYESNFNESINDKIEENKKEAEVLFEKAVSFEDDNLYAKAKLGRILINNKIDESRGLKLLEKAAETLDMGQTYLGEFYEKTEDYVKAVEFYSKAARQNRGYYSHAAQYHLNKLKGDGHVNKNIKDILRNYGNERDYGYIGTEETFERIL